MNDINLTFCLYLSVFLFASGIFVVLTKRNLISILIGIELIFNATNLLFIVFSVANDMLEGQVMAIFSIVITVCEVSIALAIIYAIYRKFDSSDVNDITEVGN